MNTAIDRDINIDADEIVENSTRHLSRKFAGIYDEAYIRPIVVESYKSFASAKIQTFVAVFTTRFADDRLRALAKIDGKIRNTMPSVCLCVCTMRGGRKWPQAGCVTSRKTASRFIRVVQTPVARSTVRQLKR
ncbi:hypothetical protein EMGBS4_18380 [Acidimicrobiaceae bacterium]|nr:hypothetical protein EMGBS4_18380 [Acidimicrobiaceae bacterium]